MNSIFKFGVPFLFAEVARYYLFDNHEEDSGEALQESTEPVQVESSTASLPPSSLGSSPAFAVSERNVPPSLTAVVQQILGLSNRELEDSEGEEDIESLPIFTRVNTDSSLARPIPRPR